MSTLGGSITSSPVALALLGASSSFQGVADRLLDYTIEEQARTAAAAAGAVTLTREKDGAGNTIIRLPELRRNDHAPADRAYDKAVMTNYANAVGYAAEEAFGRFAFEHRTDPESFRQKAQAYAEAALKEVPEQFRGALSITMEKRQGEFALKIDENVRDVIEKEELSTAFAAFSRMKAEAGKLPYLQGAHTDDVKLALEGTVQQADAMLKRFGHRLSVEGQAALRNTRSEVAATQAVAVYSRAAEDAYRKGGIVGAKQWLAETSEKLRGPLDPSTLGGALSLEGVETVLTRVNAVIERAHQLDVTARTEEKLKHAELLLSTTTQMHQEWMALEKANDAEGKTAFAQRFADLAQETSALAPAIHGFLRSVGIDHLRPGMSPLEAAQAGAERSRIERLYLNSWNDVQDDILIGEMSKLSMAPKDIERLTYNRDQARWKEIEKAENMAAVTADFARKLGVAVSNGEVSGNNPDLVATFDYIVKNSPETWNSKEGRNRFLSVAVSLGVLGQEGRTWINDAINSPDLSRILDSVEVYDAMMADPEKARTFQRELGPELAGHLAMASRMVHGQGANATPETMKAVAAQIAVKVREWNALPPDQRAAKIKDRLGGKSGYEATGDYLPGLIKDELAVLKGLWPWSEGVEDATSRGRPTWWLPLIGKFGNPTYDTWYGRTGSTVLDITSGSLWPWDVVRSVELSDTAKRTFGDLLERGIASGQTPEMAASTAYAIMRADHGLGLTTRLRDGYSSYRKALFDLLPMEQAGKNIGMEPDQILTAQIDIVKKEMELAKKGGGVINLPYASSFANDETNIMRAIKDGGIAFEPTKVGRDVLYRVTISQGPAAEAYRSPYLVSLQPPPRDEAEEAKTRASYQKARELMPTAPQGMVRLGAIGMRLVDRYGPDFGKIWAGSTEPEVEPFSTEKTYTVEWDGKFMNIPAIWNGKELGLEQAKGHAASWMTYKNGAFGSFTFPQFNTREEAEKTR